MHHDTFGLIAMEMISPLIWLNSHSFLSLLSWEILDRCEERLHDTLPSDHLFWNRSQSTNSLQTFLEANYPTEKLVMSLVIVQNDFFDIKCEKNEDNNPLMLI